MNFDEMQKAWQSQDSVAQVTINADALLREVRRNQRQFLATIFWRDLREIVVSVLLAVYFLYAALHGEGWSFYLLTFCCLEVGGFMIVDRVIQRRKSPFKHDSLTGCVQSSLVQVKHQIWLLRNVFWWYLLPLLIGLTVATGAAVWQKQIGEVKTIALGGLLLICFGLIYWGVYWLNQLAVRKQLEPRRRELEALLTELE